MQSKNYQSALIDFNRVIDRQPNNKIAYYNRAITNYNLQKTNEACSDMRKASQLGYKKATLRINEVCK